MAAKKIKAKKKRAVRKPAKKKAVKRKALKRKVLKRKPVKKVSKAAKAKVSKKAAKDVIGIVTHYFPKVKAAVIKLKKPLTVGDTIQIKGHTTDFKQSISSLQIDRVPIQSAKKGQEIGLLVISRVRQHDVVYKA